MRALNPDHGIRDYPESMSLPPLVAPIAALSAAERDRTARHASLRGFGELGQRRLNAAHVAVMGAGGLGSPIILGLAAAGIGTITVIDDDVVEASNLQRQVMHRHADIGTPKVDSAVRVAADLAPETRLMAVTDRLTDDNAADLLRGADLVIDGTDSFDTREKVAAACEQLGVPLVWGTIQEFDAQVTVFWSAAPAGHPAVRLRDLYPPGSVGQIPSCADVGVLGTVCLQVGSLMATEAIKLIAGIGEPLLGRVLVIDSLRARQREVPLAVSRTTVPAATPAAARTMIPTVSVRDVAAAVSAGTAGTVLDVREADEVVSGMIPGALHVPLAEVLADPSVFEGPVIVVCRIGPRAQFAAEALIRVGVAASVLEGGMLAWHDAHAERLV